MPKEDRDPNQESRDLRPQLWPVNLSVALVILAVGTLCVFLAQDSQVLSAHRSRHEVHGMHLSHQAGVPCFDAVIVYHKDDSFAFAGQGGFQSMKDHLLGVRKFFVVSAENETFSKYIDDRVVWIDELTAPFRKQDFAEVGDMHRAGWLYQQALKFWSVRNLPGLCNDVVVMDSDVVWVRDIQLRVPVHKPASNPAPSFSHPADSGSLQSATSQQASAQDGTVSAVSIDMPSTQSMSYKLLYNLASRESGAFVGDITTQGYHEWVQWLLGMPKVLKDTHTAIHHFMVMQRDVLAQMEDQLKMRGIKSLQEAVREYGVRHVLVSEYEGYFSYAWTYYRQRMLPTMLPYVMRAPQRCNYNDKEYMEKNVKHTSVTYWACHDHIREQDADITVNCNDIKLNCTLP